MGSPQPLRLPRGTRRQEQPPWPKASPSGSGARSRKVPGREEPPRNSESAPLAHCPARSVRLTLQSRRPSPRSHPPRRHPPWGPWCAPHRAPLASAGVTPAAQLNPARRELAGLPRRVWRPGLRQTTPATPRAAPSPGRAQPGPRGLLAFRPSPMPSERVRAPEGVCTRVGGLCVRKRACARGVSARACVRGVCAHARKYVPVSERRCARESVCAPGVSVCASSHEPACCVPVCGVSERMGEVCAVSCTCGLCGWVRHVIHWSVYTFGYLGGACSCLCFVTAYQDQCYIFLPVISLNSQQAVG